MSQFLGTIVRNVGVPWGAAVDKGVRRAVESEQTGYVGESIVGLALAVLLACCGCGAEEQELGTATEHYLAAQEAIASGNTEMALTELDASLSLQPDAWAYYQRAQLLLEKGDDAKALADCDAGLQLDAQHTELKWLQAELRKPANRRFKGRNKEPPIRK